jgi:hypothetical protein
MKLPKKQAVCGCLALISGNMDKDCRIAESET